MVTDDGPNLSKNRPCLLTGAVYYLLCGMRFYVHMYIIDTKLLGEFLLD